MMTLPSEGYREGRFDRAKKFTVFNSAGDVVENGDLPPTERMVSLNGMALGECLGKSAAIAKGENWGFTLVVKGGDQFVYIGTPLRPPMATACFTGSFCDTGRLQRQVGGAQ